MTSGTLQQYLLRSTTTAMALAAMMSPLQFQPTSSFSTVIYRDTDEPLVRQVQPLQRSLIERTDGTIEVVASAWQPEISAADFERATNNHVFTTLAEEIRSIQRLSSWSARELGEVIGVDRVTVQYWLAGKKPSSENHEVIVQINDVLKRAEKNTGQTEVPRWLITPSAADGKTPKQLLSEGNYDRARTRAMVSPTQVRQIPGIHENAGASPWSNLLEEGSYRGH